MTTQDYLDEMAYLVDVEDAQRRLSNKSFAIWLAALGGKEKRAAWVAHGRISGRHIRAVEKVLVHARRIGKVAR